MTNPSSQRKLADCLLKQETRVSDMQLDDYRQELNRRLTRAADQEQRMRLLTIGMAVVVLTGTLVFGIAALRDPQVFPLQHLFDALPDAVAAVVLAVYLACAFCFAPFLLLYFLQYRRKMQRLERDQVLATLEELERQVRELRQKSGPTDTS